MILSPVQQIICICQKEGKKEKKKKKKYNTLDLKKKKASCVSDKNQDYLPCNRSDHTPVPTS